MILHLKCKVVSTMLSFGYVKDAIASCIFVVVLLVLFQSKGSISKIWLQWFFSLAFVIDLTYTLIPSLHNTKFGQNATANLIHCIYLVIVLTTISMLMIKKVSLLR